jgi:hypothetical protein
VALTALVNGSVSGAAIQSPGYEFGEVAYFDSANGAAPVMLGGVPQILTVGNGNTSINTFQVALSPGVHVISARFLGNADWLPSVSNSVTLQVGGQATVAAK